MPEDLILWDVVEEHLDEAAFLWTQWERGLHSPLYKLHTLRDRVEERMLAHLDGLVVGGEAVAQRLLYPALTEGLGGIAFAAAMALLLSGRPEAEEAVCSALATAAPPQREEIIRALCLGPSPSRQARLLGLISGEVLEPGQLRLGFWAFSRSILVPRCCVCFKAAIAKNGWRGCTVCATDHAETVKRRW